MECRLKILKKIEKKNYLFCGLLKNKTKSLKCKKIPKILNLKKKTN